LEHRAPYVLIGAFVLAVIAASFAFVYWMGSPGGIGERAVYDIRFENSVSGLSKGAAVQFNGVRVGEVTELRFDAASGGKVIATVAVAAGTPVRSDTKAGLEFQGVTGIAAVTLEGGTGQPLPRGPGGAPPLMIAEPGAGISLTTAAREALRKLDGILTDNAEPLKSAIANINTFTHALARNSDKVDGILAGIERMTGGKGEAPSVIFDLTPPKDINAGDKQLPGAMTVPEVTTVLLYDTQKVLVRPPADGLDKSFDTARWADSLPKLIQARIVQSFENANFLGKVTRPIDALQPKFQLLIDLRRFQISTDNNSPMADIEFTAKITGDDGNVIAAERFAATAPAQVTDAATAAKALNEAFGKVAAELVKWAAGAV
jgi:phospholipid/cholesterol/gamma-HCH transport system substrate-binding protein